MSTRRITSATKKNKQLAQESLSFVHHVSHDPLVAAATRALLSRRFCTTCAKEHTVPAPTTLWHARTAPPSPLLSAVYVPLVEQGVTLSKRGYTFSPASAIAPVSILTRATQLNTEVFNPQPYLSAWTGVEHKVHDTTVPLRADAQHASQHVITVPAAKVRRTGVRPQLTHAPFFTPAELPELKRLHNNPDGDQKILAAMHRVGLHRAVPAGLATLATQSVTDAAFAAADVMDRAQLPPFLPVSPLRDDTIPTPTGVLPTAHIAWASGVPKHLPVMESGHATVQPAPPPALASLSALERWAALHEQLMTALRQPSHAMRAAVSFGLIAAICIVAPVSAVSVVHSVQSAQQEVTAVGFASLAQAGKQATTRDGEAAASFHEAAQSFGDARESLTQTIGPLKMVARAFPSLGAPVVATDALLGAAKTVSLAGERLAGALSATGTPDPLGMIATVHLAAVDLRPALVQADSALQKIPLALVPTSYQETVHVLQETVHTARGLFETLPERTEALASILGRDERKRYLVVFQNANELRATGGFIGSIAELTFEQGKMVELRVPTGGSYDVQGGLKTAIAPPTPLTPIASRWQFHDANWFPDFPTSAAKLAWFYEKSGGPSVDGVIGVTSDMLPALLTLTGPIAMPAYHRTVTADTVIREMQKIVEVEYDKTQNAPKQFVGDLLAEVLHRVQNFPAEKLPALAEVFSAALRTKTIQMAFSDPAVAAVADRAGWNGRLPKVAGDTLLVVDSNVGGGKTDAVVKKTQDVSVRVEEDGTVMHTVTLTYDHTGVSSDPFFGQTYRDYVRLYVPREATLITTQGDFGDTSLIHFPEENPALVRDAGVVKTSSTATGTDVYGEGDRTVFGKWLVVRPGETHSVRFLYSTPAPVQRHPILAAIAGVKLQSYTMALLHQAGTTARARLTVMLPDTTVPQWASSRLLSQEQEATSLNTDRFYGITYQ